MLGEPVPVGAALERRVSDASAIDERQPARLCADPLPVRVPAHIGGCRHGHRAAGSRHHDVEDGQVLLKGFVSVRAVVRQDSLLESEHVHVVKLLTLPAVASEEVEPGCDGPVDFVGDTDVADDLFERQVRGEFFESLEGLVEFVRRLEVVGVARLEAQVVELLQPLPVPAGRGGSRCTPPTALHQQSFASCPLLRSNSVVNRWSARRPTTGPEAAALR